MAGFDDDFPFNIGIKMEIHISILIIFLIQKFNFKIYYFVKLF